MTIKKEVVGIILGIGIFAFMSTYIPYRLEVPYESYNKEIFKKENFDNRKLLKDAEVLSSQLKLNLAPKYLIWGIVQATFLGLMYAFLPSIYHLFNTLNLKIKRWKYLGLSLVAIVLIFGLSGYVQQDLMMGPINIMTDYKVLIGEYSCTLNWGITALYLLAAGITLAVNFVLIERSLDDNYLKENLDYIKRTYNKLLRYTTLILVMGIVVTDLLRQAILEVVGTDNYYLFPKEFVISYSLVFSFFILIFYGPLGYKILTAANKQYGEEREAKGEQLPAGKSFLSRWDPRLVEITLSTFAPIITAILLEFVA